MARPGRQPAPVALYHLLLWCYPYGFRQEFGNQMSQCFGEQYHQARRQGGLRRVLALCLGVLADLLVVAFKEHLSMFVHDLRFAVRTLLKSPAFTMVAVATMALAIGGTTMMVSVVNRVILSPVPFRDSGRLAMVFLNAAERGAPRAHFSMADYVDWRTHDRAFEDAAAFGAWGRPFTVTGQGEPEQLPGVYATGSFFSMLGVRPAAGRLFVPDDDQPGRTPSVVISERLWRRRHGGNAQVVGSMLTVNGEAHMVVGVAPSGFRYPDRDTDVWAILPLDPPLRRGPYYLRGLGRLKPGLTFDQAEAQLKGVPMGVRAAALPEQTSITFAVVPLQEQVVGEVQPMLLLLLASVGCLLLIAIANVANLQIARTGARRREFATRLSIGADRWHIARQQLTESVMVSLTGGSIGVVLALCGVRLLKWATPAALPRVDEVTVDTTVLLVAGIVSVLAGVLFGLAPALRVWGGDLTGALNDGGRSGTGGRERGRLRAALAVTQVALSCMLLIGAGLLMRSFATLLDVRLGIDSPNLLMVEISPSGERYRDDTAARAFYRALLEGVRSMPGVQSATISSTVPPGQGGFSEDITLDGLPDVETPILLPIVDPQYFTALAIPLSAGRYFNEADTAQSAPVTIISQAMAERYYPNQTAVGKRLKIGGRGRPTPWREIVGVVGDVRYGALDATLAPAFYLPHAQNSMRSMYLVLRSSLPPSALRGALRQQVAALDSSIPVAEPGRIDDLLHASVAQPRFRTLLVTIFASVALLIAGLGLYGVLAYGVVQRQREIAIRIALGAQQRSVALMILRQAAVIGAIGIATGIVGALALRTLVSRFLFGVTANDAGTFAVVVLVLAGACLLAGYVPARRAARVDPIVSLKAG